MNALRLVLGVVSLIASMLLGVLAVFYLWGGLSLIPRTIENGQTIDREFRVAATWIDGFKKTKGHLPKQEEFEHWAKPQAVNHRWVSEMRLLTSPLEVPGEVTKMFGQLPAGGYILRVWRGEWSEYYSPWMRTSTVDTPEGLYGNTFVVSLMFFGAAIACWYLSRWCRPTRRRPAERN